ERVRGPVRKRRRPEPARVAQKERHGTEQTVTAVAGGVDRDPRVGAQPPDVVVQTGAAVRAVVACADDEVPFAPHQIAEPAGLLRWRPRKSDARRDVVQVRIVRLVTRLVLRVRGVRTRDATRLEEIARVVTRVARYAADLLNTCLRVQAVERIKGKLDVVA